MKRTVALLLVLVCLTGSAQGQAPAVPEAGTSRLEEFFSGIKAAIDRNLGRPYVWGATGQKSFDCSGFVWRVMYENGILMKRTTARKFYMMLKPASKEEQGNFGTVVFFDDLKHVGIVESPKEFYHAQSVVGTNRSQMSPYWKKMVYGYRLLPLPEK
jgi:cell wall-associated NlpC family hydrolase